MFSFSLFFFSLYGFNENQTCEYRNFIKTAINSYQYITNQKIFFLFFILTVSAVDGKTLKSFQCMVSMSDIFLRDVKADVNQGDAQVSWTTIVSWIDSPCLISSNTYILSLGQHPPSPRVLHTPRCLPIRITDLEEQTPC